ncbi:3'(2'),5'-bisphosphate nucleotidase CysQ [Planktomarina sp.]|jgi:3'(2'), 5'-bisphosphate nucleotidase|nr:3'(2'),5'-bisphosphate nucleotidase CysQ [Planktomarina sp.]
MDIFEKTAHKYPKIVTEMCSAAILAGARIMDIYSGDDFGIEIKTDDSPVTLADKIADKIIGDILAFEFPNIPIVSEESHRNLNAVMGDIYFLVDPLDGTKEFIKKTGEFTVNIALILNERAELGVVYVPVTGELYYRDLSGASYLERGVDDARSRSELTKISCRGADLENLSVVKSVSHSTPETEAYIAHYLPKKSKSAGSSLKFGLIARGIADLYPRLGRTMEWDTGAAHAVLKGAGGNVWRLDTLKELSYGKIGRENPFFVAAGNAIALRSYNGGP